MFDELSQEVEKVFEWIAENRKKCSVLFTEAKEALNIDDNDILRQILQELQKRFDSRVVQKVSDRVVLEQEYSFDISPFAAEVWSQYKKEKQQSTCPKCKNPTLENLGIVYRYRCSECGEEIDQAQSPHS